MPAKRDTYRYNLLDGKTKVYIGITNNPPVREEAHNQDKIFDQMIIEGPRVSRDTALKWEQEAIEKYRKGHGGKAPKYND